MPRMRSSRCAAAVVLERERSSNVSSRSQIAKPVSPARRRFACAIALVLVSLIGAGCVQARTPRIVSEPPPATAAGAPLSAIGGPVRRGPLEANATVRRNVDGDTISVSLTVPLTADPAKRSRNETVRLIGIDTPETKRPDTPIECFGKKASAATASLIPPGTLIRLERDVEERDRYGRILAYVFRAAR